MQTSINKELAFGIPGTHGNGQPYYADSYVTGDTSVVFGALVKLDSDGNVVAATSTTALGLAVSPNQHVLWQLPSDTRTLTAEKGMTIGVAKRGAWYVAVPSTDKANWTKGAKLTITSGKLVYNASGAAGEVLEVDDEKAIALIRIFL